VVFRREKQADSFQRQMSALRQRLGDGTENDQNELGNQLPDYVEDAYVDSGYGNDQDVNATNAGGYSFGDYPAPDDDELPALDEQGLMIPEIPAVDSQISIVSADTFWKGNLESDGSLHVYRGWCVGRSLSDRASGRRRWHGQRNGYGRRAIRSASPGQDQRRCQRTRLCGARGCQDQRSAENGPIGNEPDIDRFV
jgi:hypothetical protein